MDPLAELVGESPGVAAVREQVRQILGRERRSRRFPPILIQGETGGKGLLASLIHRKGSRCDNPFVDVNCAAIPETLLEAELFGFERGAFTDAQHPKAGLFQSAHRGTIFLDEVGLLPATLQPKLLKVIEERAMRRLGSTRSEPIDVQIITATNEDLIAGVQAPRIREDLYHRLAVVTLTLPPLRERREDILCLARHFLARACADYDLPDKELSRDAEAALITYRWPGNIRELSNVVERAALLTEAARITASTLKLPTPPPAAAVTPVSTDSAFSFDVTMDNLLFEALEHTNWNISRAAARLAVSRGRLRYQIEKRGLRPGGAGRHHRDRRKRTTEAAGAAPPIDPAPLSRLRWERRQLGLMRVDLVATTTSGSPVDASGAMAIIVEKMESFGGRVQELGPAAVMTAFGLEPADNPPHSAALAALAIQKAGRPSRPPECGWSRPRRSTPRARPTPRAFLAGRAARLRPGGPRPGHGYSLIAPAPAWRGRVRSDQFNGQMKNMPSRTVGATEFKARCLELMDDVAATGNPIVITKRGKPVARLVPAEGRPKSLVEALKGHVRMASEA